MKIQIALFTIFMSFTSLFAQNTPATKDDIKMILREMDKRFEQMDKRFEQVDKRFEMMQNNMNKRFEQVDKWFEDMQNMMFFGFSIIAAVLSFLFIQNLIMIKSIGKLELSIVQNNPVQATPEPLPQLQRSSERQVFDRSAFIAFLRDSDAQTKQEIKQLLEV